MAQLTSPLKLLLVSQPVCVEPFFSPLRFPSWNSQRAETRKDEYEPILSATWEKVLECERVASLHHVDSWDQQLLSGRWFYLYGDPSVEYYHFVCITLINPQVCHQFSFRIIADSPLANQTCLYQAAHPGIATPRENSGISMPLVLRHHQADKESEMSQMIGK